MLTTQQSILSTAARNRGIDCFSRPGLDRNKCKWFGGEGDFQSSKKTRRALRKNLNGKIVKSERDTFVERGRRAKRGVSGNRLAPLGV